MTAMAYAVEAAVNFAEVSDLDGNAYAYWRKRQAGFAGYRGSDQSSRLNSLAAGLANRAGKRP